MNLKSAFKKYCLEKKLQFNINQIETVDLLNQFYKKNKISLLNFFIRLLKKENKLAFYLMGDVGVGKTMILNFFYNHINTT